MILESEAKEVEIPAFSNSEDRSTDMNAHLVRGSCRKKNGSTKEFSVLSFLYFFYLGALFLELLLIFILYGVLLLVEIFSWKNKERLLLFIKIEFNGFKEVFLPTPSIEGVIPSILFL